MDRITGVLLVLGTVGFAYILAAHML